MSWVVPSNHGRKMRWRMKDRVRLRRNRDHSRQLGWHRYSGGMNFGGVLFSELSRLHEQVPVRARHHWLSSSEDVRSFGRSWKWLRWSGTPCCHVRHLVVVVVLVVRDGRGGRCRVTCYHRWSGHGVRRDVRGLARGEGSTVPPLVGLEGLRVEVGMRLVSGRSLARGGHRPFQVRHYLGL